MAHPSLILFLLYSFFKSPDDPKFEAQLVDSNVSIGYGLAIGDVDAGHLAIKLNESPGLG